MIRLNMIVEGQTEEAFVNEVLQEHLLLKGISVSARRVRTGSQKGGDPKFARVRREVEQWLKQEASSFVTVMIDLYRLPTDYPEYNETRSLPPLQRVEALERAMAQTINNPRFIPYIHLHEFETLLFSDPEKFDWEFMEEDAQEAIQALQRLAREQEPETINDTPEGAPSKRIIKELPAYEKRKKSSGPVIAAKIGLEKIRNTCPHFNAWLSLLEKLSLNNPGKE